MFEIDWPDFLKKEFPRGKIIRGKNGKEYNIDCISLECPNPKMHMFVNLGSSNEKHDKRFVCHRCGFGGNYKAFLVTYFNLPYALIVANLSDLYGRVTDSYEEIRKQIPMLNSELSYYEGDDTEEGFQIDLPIDYKRITHGTKYCVKRKIPNKLIRKFRIGICNDGFYKNRLIFPIKSSGNTSFLAYSQLSKSSLKKYKELYKQTEKKFFYNKSKKVLYPIGSVITFLLFNYDNIKNNEDLIIVVEGVMDAIRAITYGYSAVAKLHGFLSEYQVSLLSNKNPKEICLMPDSDVSYKRIIDEINVLKEQYEGTISVIKLPKGDPDDIKSKKKFDRVIHNRRNRIFMDRHNIQLKLL